MTHDELLAKLPQLPPMRLVEQILEVAAGQHVRSRRIANASDWYFQGHFPDDPVVPAIILVELVAQTGGLAAASDHESERAAAGLRVAAFGPFKFPDAARPGNVLETTARVVGRMRGIVKIEGVVTADGRLVASGSVVLAEVRDRAAGVRT